MAESTSKCPENTVGKGEIASYKQLLLFPQCFQNICTADTKKSGLVGRGLTQWAQQKFFFYQCKNTLLTPTLYLVGSFLFLPERLTPYRSGSSCQNCKN